MLSALTLLFMNVPRNLCFTATLELLKASLKRINMFSWRSTSLEASEVDENLCEASISAPEADDPREKYSFISLCNSTISLAISLRYLSQYAFSKMWISISLLLNPSLFLEAHRHIHGQFLVFNRNHHQTTHSVIPFQKSHTLPERSEESIFWALIVDHSNSG
ncbi:hypothetical protein AMTRI_Chr01g104140 [Amborella trichopoda]